MTKEEALICADAVLKLINSRPWTPTRDQVAEVLLKQPAKAAAHPVCLSLAPCTNALIVTEAKQREQQLRADLELAGYKFRQCF